MINLKTRGTSFKYPKTISLQEYEPLMLSLGGILTNRQLTDVPKPSAEFRYLDGDCMVECVLCLIKIIVVACLRGFALHSVVVRYLVNKRVGFCTAFQSRSCWLVRNGTKIFIKFLFELFDMHFPWIHYEFHLS